MGKMKMRMFIIFLGTIVWLLNGQGAHAEPFSAAITALGGFFTGLGGTAAAAGGTAAASGGFLSSVGAFFSANAPALIGGAVIGGTGAAVGAAGANASANAQAAAADQNAAIQAQNANTERYRQRLQATANTKELNVAAGNILARQAGSGLAGGSSDLLGALTESNSLTSEATGLANANTLQNFVNTESAYKAQSNYLRSNQKSPFAAFLTGAASGALSAATFGLSGVAGVGKNSTGARQGPPSPPGYTYQGAKIDASKIQP